MSKFNYRGIEVDLSELAPTTISMEQGGGTVRSSGVYFRAVSAVGTNYALTPVDALDDAYRMIDLKLKA